MNLTALIVGVVFWLVLVAIVTGVILAAMRVGEWIVS